MLRSIINKNRNTSNNSNSSPQESSESIYVKNSHARRFLNKSNKSNVSNSSNASNVSNTSNKSNASNISNKSSTSNVSNTSNISSITSINSQSTEKKGCGCGGKLISDKSMRVSESEQTDQSTNSQINNQSVSNQSTSSPVIVPPAIYKKESIISSPTADTTCFELLSGLNLTNNEFIYGIATTAEDLQASLIQFNGEVDIPNINDNVDSNKNSVVYMITTDLGVPDAVINNSYLLWYYDGIREEQQFAQILQMGSSNDAIVLSGFTGQVTFERNLIPPSSYSLSSSDANATNYFIARFNTNIPGSGRTEWNLPITAFAGGNVSMDIDINDNIYLTGTYQNKVIIGNLSLTSNLSNDMFMAKISKDGVVLWLKTTDKSSSPSTNGSVRGESIIELDDPSVINILGQYTDTINIQGLSLVNDSSSSHLIWVAQFDFSGNILWLKSVDPSLDNTSSDYISGSQITTDLTELYLTGILRGDFNFDTGSISTKVPVVYVAKMSLSGDWLGLNYVTAMIPNNSSFSPHIIHNSRLYLLFFALGNVLFNGKDAPLLGTGNQNMIINTLDEDGFWDCGYQITGTLSNPSINVSYSQGAIAVIGTHIINSNNTNAMLKRITFTI